MNYFTQNLSSSHRKKEFSCGKEALDSYIQKSANQDIRRKLAACFVLTGEDSTLIQGYYTLSNSGIPLEAIPESVRKRLPKHYVSIPTTLLGRLALDIRFQGKGLGKLLLVDALKRCYDASKKIASFAIIVDPIDADAEKFYSIFGFIKLPDSGKMFLPMKTVALLFD